MKNPEIRARKNKYAREAVKKLRLQVIEHYGGKCACCGETEINFLALDHINGGGSQHRKSLKQKSLYRWVVNNKYPKDLQILCHNCNMAKGLYGECPHKREKKLSLVSERSVNPFERRNDG